MNQKDVWTTKLWLKYQTHVKNLVSTGFYGMVHCPMYIYMYVDFAIKSSTKTNEIYLIIICNSNEITCQNYSPAKKNCKKESTQFCSHTYFGYGPDLLRIGICIVIYMQEKKKSKCIFLWF